MSSRASATKPFLLIDVDGVLNPFAHAGAFAPGWQTYQIEAESPFRGKRTYEVHLHSTHGRWLAELEDDFELGWGSTWEEQANSLIAPKIGLHPLPVARVGWHMDGNYDKSEGIVALVGDRPCAWVDDGPGWSGFEWRDQRLARGIPTLIITPDPAIGFTRAHKDALHRFAASLR